MKRLAVKVSGIVQGVGFRPFIYNLAGRLGLSGWVQNTGDGVSIEIEGQEETVAAFLAAIRQEAPPLAVIESIHTDDIALSAATGFQIRESQGTARHTAMVSPDIATCEQCRRELLDPADRRYRYPFINCTHCGPRYTIIQDLPYDRTTTTMAGFSMCRDCRAEYDDPADRRFHAQPNACPVCGPYYRLLGRDGRELTGDPFIRTRELVAGGGIVAVKGIGGYHLACDARHRTAAAVLRSRKIREDKPFAVMCGSLAAVNRVCSVLPAEEALLTSRQRPIVLLSKTAGYDLAAEVAPDNPRLGVMLPYAPVHWLLLGEADCWVMTSGNLSDEPIAFADSEALTRLAGIADYFLFHNREIFCRTDDSVVRSFQGSPFYLRRARGYAPAPVVLDRPLGQVLAVGGELKNTFCLTRDNLAFVSTHIGNLANQATFASYQALIEHDRKLFDIVPELVAYDLHPDYLSTRYALSLDLPQIGVQHHHAHIAAVMAEHGLAEPVIGVAFDGTGYGPDGTIWGGEFLLAERAGYRRLAHCRTLPLPGGDKAVREPWRVALAILYELYGRDLAGLSIPFARNLPAGWELVTAMIEKKINTPLTSSAGRLFDAAAALLGIRQAVHYEGQAAIELELAAGPDGMVLPYSLWERDMAELDFRPAFIALVAAIQRQEPVSGLAAAFHTTVACGIIDCVKWIKRRTGVTKVALAGGVFQNIRLLHQTVASLGEAGFTVYLPRQVPPNDGGLSLGQAVVAAAKYAKDD